MKPKNFTEIHDWVRANVPDAVVSEGKDHAGQPFLVVKKDRLKDLCRRLKDDPETKFDLCACVGGLDDGKTMWSVYHLYSVPFNHKVVLKVEVGRTEPSVPTVSDIWRAADWHERETYDMYGIVYEGHPDPRRILLPEDWEGYPLRKDYPFPEEHQGIPLR